MGLPNPQDLADALTAVRARPPLVQCLTNIVVAGWTANVLLAVGADPAIVDSSQEAGQFATIVGCVLVNLGTPYDDTARAMHLAVAGAKQMGTPWVLDPVAAGALAWRTTLVTGGGCALGALMAVFAAVVPDAMVAAAAATATLTVAAESAAKQTRGPGSFAVALLDELSLLQPTELANRVRST